MSYARFVGAGFLVATTAMQASAPPAAIVSTDRATGCTPQFAPLTTGSSNVKTPLKFWRRDEAGEWGGDGWLGWRYDEDALIPVSLSVRELPKERSDDESEVTVESSADVTFAMRCIDVPTLHIRPAGIVNHSLRYREPLHIALGERQYQVALRGSREDLTDAKVILSQGNRAQVLYSTEGFVDEPLFEVNWAGDLDGDGLLDLVVLLTRKYSIHPYRLLLSSVAAPDELVGEAASFETLD
jgi:hypothetical protein